MGQAVSQKFSIAGAVGKVMVLKDSVRVTCVAAKKKMPLLNFTDWFSKPVSVTEPWGKELAVTKVPSGEMSIRLACVCYSVPRRTLHNRVKGIHRPKPEHQTVFNEAKTKSLVHHIQVVSQWGFPFPVLDMHMVPQSVLEDSVRVTCVAAKQKKTLLNFTDWFGNPVSVTEPGVRLCHAW